MAIFRMIAKLLQIYCWGILTWATLYGLDYKNLYLAPFIPQNLKIHKIGYNPAYIRDTTKNLAPNGGFSGRAI